MVRGLYPAAPLALGFIERFVCPAEEGFLIDVVC